MNTINNINLKKKLKIQRFLNVFSYFYPDKIIYFFLIFSSISLYFSRFSLNRLYNVVLVICNNLAIADLLILAFRYNSYFFQSERVWNFSCPDESTFQVCWDELGSSVCSENLQDFMLLGAEFICDLFLIDLGVDVYQIRYPGIPCAIHFNFKSDVLIEFQFNFKSDVEMNILFDRRSSWKTRGGLD